MHFLGLFGFGRRLLFCRRRVLFGGRFGRFLLHPVNPQKHRRVDPFAALFDAEVDVGDLFRFDEGGVARFRQRLAGGHRVPGLYLDFIPQAIVEGGVVAVVYLDGIAPAGVLPDRLYQPVGD